MQSWQDAPLEGSTQTQTNLPDVVVTPNQTVPETQPGTGGTAASSSNPKSWQDAPLDTESTQFLTAGGQGAIPKISESDPGLPPDLRIGLGFKMTPEGRASYLEHYFGQGNVITDRSGALYYRPEEKEPFRNVEGPTTPLNPGAVVQADIGKLAENVPQAVVGALPNILTSAIAPEAAVIPPVAGAAAAVGSGLRQGISSLLPGSDQLTPLDRLEAVGKDALTSGVMQGGLNALGKVIDSARIGNIIKNVQSRSGVYDTPLAIRGEELQNETGVPLTPGQMTGNKLALWAEGVARRYPTSMNIMNQFDRNQWQAISDRVNNIIDKADKTGWDQESFGNAVTNTFGQSLQDALQVRKTAAARDFGAFDKLNSSNPIIPTTNTLSTLDDLIDRFNVPGGGDATQSLVNRLKSVRDELTDPQGAPTYLSGQEVNRLLQIYGSAASGTGKIFTDIDNAQQRFVAQQFLSGLNKDLDAVTPGNIPVRNPTTGRYVQNVPGKVVDALRNARSNYNANSNAIDELRNMTLGRLLNTDNLPPAETITNKLMTMEPSRLGPTIDLLAQKDPRIVGSLQSQFLQKAVDAATNVKFTPATQAAVSGVTPEPGLFSSAKFLNALPPPKVIDAVFGKSPDIQKDLVNISEIMARAARREGEGSPTAPLNWMVQLLTPANWVHPDKMIDAAAGGLGSRAMARALTEPQGRAAITQLMQNKGLTSASLKQTLHSASYFLDLADRTTPQGNVRPPP